MPGFLRVFCDSCNPYINVGNPVPCGKINDTGYRKPEDGLELPDGVCGCLTIDSVGRDTWNRSIDASDCIKLLLDLANLISAGTDG